MDLVSAGLYTLAVSAVTEFAKRLKARDFMGAGTIVVCLVIGLGAGYFGLTVGGVHFTLLTGAVSGLAAAGLNNTAATAGGK